MSLRLLESDPNTVEPTGTSVAVVEAETSSRPRRQIVDPSSSEEEEDMQRRRPPVVVTNLEARVFGDRAPRTALSTGAASASAPTSTSSAAADASTLAPTSPPSTGV
ncbi:hypothetical protein MRB53_020505 [Persea americana]|uniref:Uncharacterized protein n=1 Tax=Persea americana TaxID=3435 RepID=A0ACC2L1G6_PERAE|nr:hypothetical protein MRB53_020505 [Persea americana]